MHPVVMLFADFAREFYVVCLRHVTGFHLWQNLPKMKHFQLSISNFEQSEKQALLIFKQFESIFLYPFSFTVLFVEESAWVYIVSFAFYERPAAFGRNKESFRLIR